MKKLRDRGYDWLAWAFFLVIPFVVFWQIATSLADQGFASGGPLNNAAIFPRIVAWIMFGLAAISAVQLLLGRVLTPSPIATTPTTRHGLIATAVFVIYLLLLAPLGFYITSPIMIALLLTLFGLAPLSSVVGGLIMTIAVAFVFEGLLNVILPLGFLKFTLFG